MQTPEGLLLAVVDAELLDHHIVCCLRYIPSDQGLSKLSTSQATQYLETRFPQYLQYSEQLDTRLHCVPRSRVHQHYQPNQRLEQICAQPTDQLETLTAQLASYFVDKGLAIDKLGVSGSILIAAHNSASDIDLVVYGRNNFFKARNRLREILDNNQHRDVQPLTTEQWQQSWQRRGSDLSLQDYMWHEQRKYNKASIHGVKFDLVMVETQSLERKTYRKQGVMRVKATVTDAGKAYDYPVSYVIDHPRVQRIICYSATYTGQACTGERIEAKGILEQADDGACRLLIGSSREAPGEYLKIQRTV